MKASLLSGEKDLLYEVPPRYAFGRFYVEAADRDTIAFLCPGDLVRQALNDGSALLEAQGDGLGWHYPYHLRRHDDGNQKGVVTRLRLRAARRRNELQISAELEVENGARTFNIQLTLEPEDLANIGPPYAELWYGKPVG